MVRYQNRAGVRASNRDCHSRPAEVHEGEVRLPTHTFLGQQFLPTSICSVLASLSLQSRVAPAGGGACPHLKCRGSAAVCVVEAQLPIVVAAPALERAANLRFRSHLSARTAHLPLLYCPPLSNALSPWLPLHPLQVRPTLQLGASLAQTRQRGSRSPTPLHSPLLNTACPPPLLRTAISQVQPRFSTQALTNPPPSTRSAQVESSPRLIATAVPPTSTKGRFACRPTHPLVSNPIPDMNVQHPGVAVWA